LIGLPRAAIATRGEIGGVRRGRPVIEEHMKLSIALTPTRTVFSPLLFAGDIMRGIRRAGELGYDGVELNIRDTAAEPMDDIIAAARARSLDVCAFGTGQAYLLDGLSVTSPDPSVRERLAERLERHIDWAAKAGALLVMGGVFGRMESDASIREAQYAGAVEVVRRLAEYAGQRGVSIAIEPINRYETNFLTSIDKVLSLLADVDRPAVRVLADTFHMNIEEADLRAAISLAGGRLGHVHLVDSNRWAPGGGHIDFPQILRALRAIGYDGYLSGEFLPLPDDETAASRNIAYVRPLLEAVAGER
jgi:sugar phosphate isomerase/epimerase